MKKLAVFCLLIAIVIPNVIAQNNPLYDVNYDAPKKIANYDNAFDEFQKIYLQYESAIKTTNDIIRQEEKEAYQKELNNFKIEERIRTNNTISEMRKAIYGNEVDTVRKQETERLTIELTEKISTELEQKLSSEYEKIKNDEIAELYENLKDEAYKETGAITQRLKSVSTAIAIIFIFIITILIIIFLIRNTIETKASHKSLVSEYLIRLKAYNGEPYNISQEINKVYGNNAKQKNIRMNALSEAQNLYTDDIKEIQDYKDEFESYRSKLNNYLKLLNNDNYPQISSFLFDIYGQYKKTGQELAHSLDFRTKAVRSIANNILHEISNELKDFSKVIKTKNVKEQFTNQKKQLAKDFFKLAKSFRKGEF